jgi:type I restriction enzyme M protein
MMQRDVYVRGKYRDVILPMSVLRRLDWLLEPNKEKVLKHYKVLEEGHFGQNEAQQGLTQRITKKHKNTLPLVILLN